jgi:hypothetical protein
MSFPVTLVQSEYTSKILLNEKKTVSFSESSCQENKKKTEVKYVPCDSMSFRTNEISSSTNTIYVAYRGY